jgi:hypothetical protein
MQSATTAAHPIATLEQARSLKARVQYQAYLIQLSLPEIKREVDFILHHLNNDHIWKLDLILVHLEQKSTDHMAQAIRKLRKTVYEFLGQTLLELSEASSPRPEL